MKILFFLSIISFLVFPQNNSIYNQYGKLYKLNLDSAPFPHQKRSDGHTYSGTKYPADIHYSDNSVAVFVPKGFVKTDETDFVFYFHGWYSNIDSSLKKFELIKQFYESNKNAIFIFPEGPRNSPDSFGGKLEDKNGIQYLLDDIIDYLYSNNIIKSNKIGKIVLSGHSGAYKVISFILMRGGIPEKIKEVYLFDALYDETEKYVYWIDKYNGRFINIYTDDGGTKTESLNLADDFEGWGMAYKHIDEKLLNDSDLLDNRILLIHSNDGHNDVIATQNQFLKFLRTSCLENIK